MRSSTPDKAMKLGPLLIGFLVILPLAHNQAYSTGNPIKHVIVIMQENHTYDNYFGTYPGANGIPQKAEVPTRLRGGPDYVDPFPLRTVTPPAPNNDRQTALTAYDGGKMDGFYVAQKGNEAASYVMGYFDYHQIGYYWNLARSYVLFDNFFSSFMGASLPNHFYLCCAQTPTLVNSVPAKGYNVPTIFDELQAKNISWKVYVEHYKPDANYTSTAARHRLSGSGVSQLLWVPLLDMPRYVQDQALNSRIVDASTLDHDLAKGLPSVSYVLPDGLSEHPPGNVTKGQLSVVKIVDAVMKSKYWSSTALFVTWDDWGGWYDHVAPPQVDGYGYGFRVPLLLISAYAKTGYVDHTQCDFTCILKLIEDSWNLGSLSSRDASAASIKSAFDLTAPRQPILPTGAHASAPTNDPSSGFNDLLYPMLTTAAAAVTIPAYLLLRRRGN